MFYQGMKLRWKSVSVPRINRCEVSKRMNRLDAHSQNQLIRHMGRSIPGGGTRCAAAWSALRGERTQELLTQIKRTGQLPYRMKSGAAESATRLAQALYRSIDPEDLKERLALLGFDNDWASAKLQSLSLTGGGVRVISGIRGQIRTGPRIDRLIDQVFPELIWLRMTNSMFTAHVGDGVAGAYAIDPSTTGIGVTSFDLSQVSVLWNIKEVVAEYQLQAIFSPKPTMTFEVTDGYGHQSYSYTSFQGGAFFSNWLPTWVKQNVGKTDARGPLPQITVTPGGNTTWFAEMLPDVLAITYVPPTGCPQRTIGSLSDGCPAVCRDPETCKCIEGIPGGAAK